MICMKYKKTNILICFISILLFNISHSFKYTNPNNVIIMDISQCNTNQCSPIGGICLSSTKCICKNCFSTKYSNPQILCSYSQSSSTTSAILELLFPIGIGHFYTGTIAFGFFKMIIGYIMFYGIYVIVIYYFIHKRTSNFEVRQPLTRGYETITVTLSEDIKRLNLLVILSQGLFIVFHLIDVYLLFSACYFDGNNMPLC